jgi:hypothetical protein
MTKLEKKEMQAALETIKRICDKTDGKECKGCPAFGRGKLCHSGKISCCSPNGWYKLECDSND